MFIAALSFAMGKIMDRIQMSINWWMDKEYVVYTYNGILLGDQKEWNLTICKNVDGTREYNAKENKSVRERQIPYDFTHMWNLRNKIDEHMVGGREREWNKP